MDGLMKGELMDKRRTDTRPVSRTDVDVDRCTDRRTPSDGGMREQQAATRRPSSSSLHSMGPGQGRQTHKDNCPTGKQADGKISKCNMTY